MQQRAATLEQFVGAFRLYEAHEQQQAHQAQVGGDVERAAPR